jgi:hypothetical protein
LDLSSNAISRVLYKYNNATLGLPPRKVTFFLQPIKDDHGLKSLGIYSMPCECGKVYIGQIGCSIDTRMKEHHPCIQLFIQRNQSLLSTGQLATASNFMAQVYWSRNLDTCNIL